MWKASDQCFGWVNPQQERNYLSGLLVEAISLLPMAINVG
jgi:hypothetical protein